MSDRDWPDRGASQKTRAKTTYGVGQVPDVHRLLPHSIEAEQGILGSMLISPRDAIPQVMQLITADYFYIPAHQTIFTEAVRAWKTDGTLDLITFTTRLRNRNLLDHVGGASFITSLFTFVPTAANVGYYIEIVRDKYVLREIIETCTEGARRAYEEQDEVEELCLKPLQKKILAIQARGRRQKTIKEIVGDMVDALNEPQSVLGVSSGFPTLDAVIGGFARQQKIVVAGATSSGKSALVAQFANSLAVDRKMPCALFTFEMSAEESVQRLAQIRSCVSIRGDLLVQQPEMFLIDQFHKATNEIAQSPLTVVSDRLDVEGIRSKCVQLKQEGLRFCLIDYFQIIPEPHRKGESTTERLDRMSVATKQIASDLDITVIELSQVTVDEKSGKTTTRYSSGITNDADKLLVIQGSDDDAKDRIEKEIVVAKQRNGGKGRVAFTFHKPTTTFREKKGTY